MIELPQVQHPNTPSSGSVALTRPTGRDIRITTEAQS
jgi:hypothetical protein